MNVRAPVVISGLASSDMGLLCAFHIVPPAEGAPPAASAGVHSAVGAVVRELAPADIESSIQRADGVTWLHFNLANARARQLIAQAEFLPVELREAFASHDVHRRVEAVEGGLFAVISDLTFEDSTDPAEVAPLWAYVSGRLFVTGRTHPLQTSDKLRAAVRMGLRVDRAMELLLWILNRRTASLRTLAAEMTEQVNEIEVEILSGRIREQREVLGRMRRFCAQLRRHFSPDRTALRRLLQQTTSTLAAEDVDGMRTEVEDLSFLIDDVLELYERSKLLQEELASRVAENTGRSLYVLAILSAVFLPMTLITGIFGMNVAGLPGLTGHVAFWWVLALIIAAGGATLALIFRRDRG